MKRTFLRTCAVVSAMTAGVFGAVSDLHAQVDGRAFGIAGQVPPAPAINPRPEVTLPPGGGTATDSIQNFSGVDPVLAGLVTSGTVTVITSSQQNPSGTPIPLNTGIYSFARVEDLQIGGLAGLLPALVSADQITATCTNGPAGLTGGTEFTGTTVLGAPVNAPPPANTVLPITIPVFGNVGSITLNGQATSTVGSVKSLAVTGIRVQTTAIFGVLVGMDLEFLRAECSVTAPAMTSIIPTSGPTSGGTLVTITGNNFLQLAGVSFGGTPATTINVLDDNELTVLSPPHAAGAVNVNVTTAGGVTSSQQFTYIATPAPVLTSLSPTAGPLPGGNLVTITGSNFGNSVAGVTVTFGGNAGAVMSVSSGQLTVTAPAGAAPGTVNVTVTTPSGSSGLLPYTYVGVPTMSSLNPPVGPVAGGNNVFITGTNFGNSIAGVTVMFGANQAVVTSVSPTQIAVNAPAAGRNWRRGRRRHDGWRPGWTARVYLRERPVDQQHHAGSWAGDGRYGRDDSRLELHRARDRHVQRRLCHERRRGQLQHDHRGDAARSDGAVARGRQFGGRRERRRLHLHQQPDDRWHAWRDAEYRASG